MRVAAIYDIHGNSVEPDPDDATAAASRWCAEELTDEQRAFLTRQPETLAIDIDGLGPKLFINRLSVGSKVGGFSPVAPRRFHDVSTATAGPASATVTWVQE